MAVRRILWLLTAGVLASCGILAVWLAVDSSCPPDKDVCARSLDISVTDRPRFEYLNVGQIRDGLARLATWFGDATVGVVNHWLIIAAIILILFLSAAFLWRQRHYFRPLARRMVGSRLSLREQTHPGQRDKRLALIHKIHTQTGELRAAVDEIRTILSTYVEPRPGASLTFRAALDGSSNEPNRKEISESDAQVILVKILRQLIGVSAKLTGVQNDAQQVDRLSTRRSLPKSNFDDSEAKISQLQSALRERESEIRHLTDRNAHLSREREQAISFKLKGEKFFAEAHNLLTTYEQGLPPFLNTREQGSHFPTFTQFLTDANAKLPGQVTRLAMMLRVIADARVREDSGFELIWSVHEAGKALYALMQVLGYDQGWQFEEANAWAQALNKCADGRYTVFVPIAKSAFNGIEMTGGTPQSLIREIKSWGVKNRRGDVERKAIVK